MGGWLGEGVPIPAGPRGGGGGIFLGGGGGGGDYEKLAADDAGDGDGVAAGDRLAGFLTGRGGVARAALDVGDFPHAAGRDGRDDGGHGAGEGADVRFTRALRTAEQFAQQGEHARGNQRAAHHRQRGADQRVPRRRDLVENDAEPAERRDERAEDRGAHRRDARRIAGVGARLGMAAAAVEMLMAPAEEVPEHGGQDGEDQTRTQAAQINEEVHEGEFARG